LFEKRKKDGKKSYGWDETERDKEVGLVGGNWCKKFSVKMRSEMALEVFMYRENRAWWKSPGSRRRLRGEGEMLGEGEGQLGYEGGRLGGSALALLFSNPAFGSGGSVEYLHWS